MMNQSVPRLRQLGAPVPLPVRVSGQLMCAPLDERLHVVALRNETGRTGVCHFTIDVQGELDGPVRDLPATHPFGLSACAGELVLVATDDDSGDMPVAIGLDARGATAWRSPIPVHGRLSAWPTPVGVHDQPAVVWATDVDPAGVWVARVGPGVTSLPWRISDAAVSEVTAAARASDDQLVVLRVGSLSTPELALARVPTEAPSNGPGATTWQSVPDAGRPVSASVAVVNGQVLALWVAGAAGELRIQVLDRDLRSANPVQVVVAAGANGTPRKARLTADSGRVAINYQVATPAIGAAIPQGPDRPHNRALGIEREQFVAMLDPTTGAIGQPEQLHESGTHYDSSAWVGSRLMVIHGSYQPWLTTFQSLV